MRNVPYWPFLSPLVYRSSRVRTSALGRDELQDEETSRLASGVPGLNWRDGVGISLGVLLTLAICYVFSHGRIFWEDEMLGWMLIHDPSWHHMIEAWKVGADAGGISFYLTGRAWFAIFGGSEISFRMYSAACFSGAFAALWIAARRYYGVGAVAFALFNTFFFAPPLVQHMAEGRFYGLLMLGAALAVAVAVTPARSSQGEAAALCLAAFLANGILVTSHLLGVAYSVAILFAVVLSDWSKGKIRPLLYVSVVLSWFLLVGERASIMASAQVGKPHFWTTQPSIAKAMGAYTAYSPEVAIVLLVLAVGVFLALRSDRDVRGRLQKAYEERRPVYWVALALLFVPVVFFVEGLVGPSLYISRYLLPVMIAQIFLTAEAVTLISWEGVRRSALGKTPVQVLAAGLFAVVLLGWVFGYVRKQAVGKPNYTDALSALLPKGSPVLCEQARTFIELIGRQHESDVQYSYLLDWPYSITKSAPRGEVADYHLMENWRKAGYFGGSILDRDSFLKEHSEFFVLHSAASHAVKGAEKVGNPLAERFASDPAYTVEPYTSLSRDNMTYTITRVCRGTCGLVSRK